MVGCELDWASGRGEGCSSIALRSIACSRVFASRRETSEPRQRSRSSNHAWRNLLAVAELAWPYTTVELLSKLTGRSLWLVEADLGDLEDRQVIQRLSDGRAEPLVQSDVLHEWSTPHRQLR